MNAELFPIRVGPNCRCVSVRGDLDLANANALARALETAAREGPTVVDLSECSYLDSTGLSVFVRHERAHRGALVVVAPRAQRSLRIFEIPGLALTLTVRQTLEDAYATIAGSRLPRA